MKKQDLLALLDELPDEFDTEALIYQLYVRSKIERGTAEMKRGEVMSHEDVVKEMETWFE